MHRCLVVFSLLLTLAACSKNEAPVISGVSVTGTLVTLQDAVPVDGGVTLEVEAASGTRTMFHIPSFFTPNPIPEGRWELYQHVTTFSVGDRVRATGEPTESGLLLTSLEHANP